MDRTARIYVAGHRGLLGSALVRRLGDQGYGNLIVRTRAELDLRNPDPVSEFLKREKPEVVFLAAGRGGGIQANRERPDEFREDNLRIQESVLRGARESAARKVYFFGCGCVYPRNAAQPMKEESIGTGPMEPTSEAFSTAKLRGLELCRETGAEAIIPATLYGPHDDFDPAHSHVLSGLVRRFDAGDLSIWGSGAPVREFLYVDDLADACLFLMNLEGPIAPSPINIGTGKGICIRDLAEQVRRVVGAEGDIQPDPTKPDGAPEKALDVAKMTALGWTAPTTLEEGLKRTYAWFLQNAK